MCSKTTPFLPKRSMRTRKLTSLTSSTSTSTSTCKPSRKTRTKTRKHKFISIRRDLSVSQSQSQSKPSKPKPCNNKPKTKTKTQLDLFPLHPEEKEVQEENVAYIFDADGGARASLNEFLWGSGCTTVSSEHSFSYPYVGGRGQDEECRGGGGGGVSFLERTALRGQEGRDPSDEKWVCYSEVVEKKEKQEDVEMSWCVPELWKREDQTSGGASASGSGRLSLKLDYQEIMDAWSDKGPLYIGIDQAQVVPDVLDDANPHVMGGVGNLWKVPDDGSSNVMDNGESWKVGSREARVLRYREKRRNRLFSKKIRYEVRKLNAEKRPRLKGRFVKRS